MEQKPVRPPMSGYLLFCQENQQQFADKEFTERSKCLGEMWKQLGETDKQMFNDKSKQQLEQYTQQLNNYYQKYPEIKKLDEEKQNAHERAKLMRRSQDAFKAYCLTATEDIIQDKKYNEKSLLKQLRNSFKQLSDEQINNMIKIYAKLSEQQKQEIQQEFQQRFPNQTNNEENQDEQ